MTNLLLNPDALEKGVAAFQRAYYRAGDSRTSYFEKGLRAYLTADQLNPNPNAVTVTAHAVNGVGGTSYGGSSQPGTVNIAEILEAHMIKPGVRDYRTHCKCGWVTPNGEIGPMFHRAHVAEVLDKHMQEQQAEAWDAGADEVHLFGDLFDVEQAIAANPFREGQ